MFLKSTEAPKTSRTSMSRAPSYTLPIRGAVEAGEGGGKSCKVESLEGFLKGIR